MNKIMEFWCDYWHFICFGLYVIGGVVLGIVLNPLHLPEWALWLSTIGYGGIGVLYCSCLGCWK